MADLLVITPEILMSYFNEENFNEKLNLDELCKQQKITHEHKIKIYQKDLSLLTNTAVKC